MMKNSFLFIFLFLITAHGNAQKDYQAVAEKFLRLYNQELGDSIFNMYAPVLQGQLPLEKNRAVITGLHIQFGDLRALKLIKQDTGYAKYKADFQHQTLTLVLALSKEDLIEGLRFIPYSLEAPKKDSAKAVSNIILKTTGGNIYGTLVMPDMHRKLPVILIIAGSGPTDRNGNQGESIRTDTYKQIADSLFKKGIATLRYDKRGIGESSSAMKTESDLSFEDGIIDAGDLIHLLKDDQRFSKIFVLGHSEGSLIGMVAALRAKADGFISVAGAGERIYKIIEQQLKAKSPALAARATKMFDSLNNGLSVNPGADLLFLFRPSVQPYLKSWMKYNPQMEIKKLKIPVLILQGTTDMQVSVQDAKLLKAAYPSAKLVLIPQMNHVLKQSGSDVKENTAIYTNPSLPLKSELVNEIEKFVLAIN